MLARAGYLAIAVALLLSQACVLDWKLPESSAGGAGGATGSGAAGGEGGSGLPFPVACCKLCNPAPSLCAGRETLDLVPTDGICKGYYFFRGSGGGGGQAAGSCEYLPTCNCDNCDVLPDSEDVCDMVVAAECNGCLID